MDNDGIPDQPYRVEFDDSRNVIEFPLGFCPGAAAESFVYAKTNNKLRNATEKCRGQWGLVLKEWETITAVNFLVTDKA